MDVSSSRAFEAQSFIEMKLKFIVAGPKGSGKTLISNCIVGQSDKLTTEAYNPTAGVRILEHEMRLGGINEDINIELWDASGDQKYEYAVLDPVYCAFLTVFACLFADMNLGGEPLWPTQTESYWYMTLILPAKTNS